MFVAVHPQGNSSHHTQPTLGQKLRAEASLAILARTCDCFLRRLAAKECECTTYICTLYILYIYIAPCPHPLRVEKWVQYITKYPNGPPEILTSNPAWSLSSIFKSTFIQSLSRALSRATFGAVVCRSP